MFSDIKKKRSLISRKKTFYVFEQTASKHILSFVLMQMFAR